VTATNIAWILALVVVPMIVLTMTCFVKISVVLAAVRSALGTSELPSTLIITAISFALTVFAMAPVGLRIAVEMQKSVASVEPATASPWRAVIPTEYQAGAQKLERALEPLREFLQKRCGAEELASFQSLAAKSQSGDPSTAQARGDQLWILAPAFLITELKSAFAIAILLLLPFLLIDLLVAVGIGALGLQSLTPQTVALPLKLLLFVAIDGWRLIVEGLLRGYT
jgi:type III secretion protein R